MAALLGSNEIFAFSSRRLIFSLMTVTSYLSASNSVTKLTGMFLPSSRIVLSSRDRDELITRGVGGGARARNLRVRHLQHLGAVDVRRRRVDCELRIDHVNCDMLVLAIDELTRFRDKLREQEMISCVRGGSIARSARVEMSGAHLAKRCRPASLRCASSPTWNC